MKCKYCNLEMTSKSEIDNYKFKLYKCKCNATCIISVNTNDELWYDGKPPRVVCMENFMNFKKGETYRIIDADTYNVLVQIGNSEQWIDKDNNKFKIYM